MKSINRALTVGAIATAICACGTVRADDSSKSDLYRANEFSVDLFGSVSVNQEVLEDISGNHIRDDGRLGAGVGVNYFITRNLGIGADAYTEDTHDQFVDSTEGHLIFRIPIGNSGFAPYVYAGGGYQFDKIDQTFWDAGAGFEYRFTRNFGVFVDGRYVFADETDNYGLGRAGVRFSF